MEVSRRLANPEPTTTRAVLVDKSREAVVAQQLAAVALIRAWRDTDQGAARELLPRDYADAMALVLGLAARVPRGSTPTWSRPAGP